MLCEGQLTSRLLNRRRKDSFDTGSFKFVFICPSNVPVVGVFDSPRLLVCMFYWVNQYWRSPWPQVLNGWQRRDGTSMEGLWFQSSSGITWAARLLLTRLQCVCCRPTDLWPCRLCDSTARGQRNSQSAAMRSHSGCSIRLLPQDVTAGHISSSGAIVNTYVDQNCTTLTPVPSQLGGGRQYPGPCLPAPHWM